jgi:hypothetical protein
MKVDINDKPMLQTVLLYSGSTCTGIYLASHEDIIAESVQVSSDFDSALVLIEQIPTPCPIIAGDVGGTVILACVYANVYWLYLKNYYEYKGHIDRLWYLCCNSIFTEHLPSSSIALIDAMRPVFDFIPSQSK